MLLYFSIKTQYIVSLYNMVDYIGIILDKVASLIYNIVSQKEGGDTMSIFSEKISVLMMKKNISQRELAKKAGVTESAMSYYVSGSRVPRSDVLIRIANALETSSDYLLGNTNDPTPIPESKDLLFLQRNLNKLDEEQLKKAKTILSSVFDDIFNDEED